MIPAQGKNSTEGAAMSRKGLVNLSWKNFTFLRPLGFIVAGVAALGLIALPGCSHDGRSGGGPVIVSLSYTPEHARDSIKPYPVTVPQTRIYVGRFEDQRDKKDSIGVNSEHSTPVRVLTNSDPAEFFRQTLATQLRRAGLNVVDDAAQADRIITGNLVRFWVEEANNYQADVEASIRVVEKAGAEKWQGSATGHGENFGSSLSPENYRQTLSDAMVRLTYENLLTNPGFQDAIK
jgi:hypothetical protein